MFFLRKSNLERLPVAMSGVRMGERALQIGIDDPSIAGAIAAKVGLSGHAVIAVNDDHTAAKARAAAAAVGVLVDVHVTPFDSLPFPGDSFDAIILHAGAAALQPLEGTAAVAILREGHRVLRTGGRMLVLEGGPPPRSWGMVAEPTAVARSGRRRGRARRRRLPRRPPARRARRLPVHGGTQVGDGGRQPERPCLRITASKRPDPAKTLRQDSCARAASTPHGGLL